MQTIAWQVKENTVILVHGAQEPTDAEWTRYVDELRRVIKGGGQPRVLVVTSGPGPNMRQRKQLGEVFEGVSAHTAVVTSSTVGRAIVTLIGLRNPGIRAFEPSRMDEALSYILVPESEKQQMHELVSTLRSQLTTG